MAEKQFLDYHGTARLVSNIKNNAAPHLASIAITRPPNKTVYEQGDIFDPTGMIVTAYYSNGASGPISSYTIQKQGPLSEGDSVITIQYTEGGIVQTAVQPISVKYIIHIYGVEWDWENNNLTKGVRTNDASEFEDPNPAQYNGTGSSPFDTLYPWSGMVKEVRAGGVEVKEPKYWFKWTKRGKKLKLQIADGPADGFHVDPVNMDRGDGLGELDFSYIGRYHCAASNWKSETNKSPRSGYDSRESTRAYIHMLGANIWQIDYAQFWYVGMLYLVEFADWDGQATIGLGCVNNSFSDVAINGHTDAMQYHTGSTGNRADYGSIQYRNIEGWWSEAYDWIDGVYVNSTGMYIIQDPSKFNDTKNGILIGKPGNANTGFPSVFSIPEEEGLEWALFPLEYSGSQTTYVPDAWNIAPSFPTYYHGGGLGSSKNFGPFFINYASAGTNVAQVACRLQERPPKVKEVQ